MGTMAAAINLATEAEKKKKNAAALTALSANKTPGVGASTAATNQQSVTASALSPTAATNSSGSTTVNPYLDTDGSKKASFVASLQPDIRKATDAVTSSVNPFMTGNVGASLLRDVQSPALKAISEYDLGQQEKATDWTADQITVDKKNKKEKVDMLTAAYKANPSPELKKALNAAMNEYMGTSGDTLGTPVSGSGNATGGIDYAGEGDTTAIKKAAITASTKYGNIASQLDSQIEAADLTSDDTAYRDYQNTYKTLADKVSAYQESGVSVDQADLDALNKWSQAYTDFLNSVNAKASVGDTAKAWAKIKAKYGL